jgi:hypothetical protein
MKSHEERLHKLIIERKIGDTKDLMQCVSNEINNNNFFATTCGRMHVINSFTHTKYQHLQMGDPKDLFITLK